MLASRMIVDMFTSELGTFKKVPDHDKYCKVYIFVICALMRVF